MKRNMEDTLWDYYEDLDDDHLELSENTLKKVLDNKKRPAPRKFPR